MHKERKPIYVFWEKKKINQQTDSKKCEIKRETKRNTKRILLAEDDFSSRRSLNTLLSQYGSCDIMMDGEETVNAFMMALEEGDPYVLVCLETELPVMNGYQVLKKIRGIEEQNDIAKDNPVKIILMAEQDPEVNTNETTESACDMILLKPITAEQLQAALERLELF